MRLTRAQQEALEHIAADPQGLIYRFDRNVWTTPQTPLRKPIDVLSTPTWWSYFAVEWARPQIEELARGGKMPPLLPSGKLR